MPLLDSTTRSPAASAALQVEVEWRTGGVRSVRWNGVEVCCGITFLGRGPRWETLPTQLPSPPTLVESADAGWTLTYTANLGWAGGVGGTSSSELMDADGGGPAVDGRAWGSEGPPVELDVTMTARLADTGLPELSVAGVCRSPVGLTVARMGFVALHPLAVAGHPVRVTRADGTETLERFPTLVAPEQPFTAIRGLSHAVGGGVAATYRFEGEDEWEMEDQRQWCDSSFKTCVSRLPPSRQTCLPPSFSLTGKERAPL